MTDVEQDIWGFGVLVVAALVLFGLANLDSYTASLGGWWFSVLTWILRTIVALGSGGAVFVGLFVAANFIGHFGYTGTRRDR